MAKGIFTFKPDSKYDDDPAVHYQFPRTYLKRVSACAGDWVAYYVPKKTPGIKERMGYFAVAQVADVVPDPAVPDRFRANIVEGSFTELEQFVPLHPDGGLIESALAAADGSFNRGLIQRAVRPVSDRDFARLLALGFPASEGVLPRRDPMGDPAGDFTGKTPGDPAGLPGLAEEQAPFLEEFDRERVAQFLNRPRRDRAFRHRVLAAYGDRCALTGLQFINGGGRAEAEAAHIRPVDRGGPDAVRNGIALSGTVHWMFDRGLISLSDDLDILVSRQVNNPDEVWRLMNPERKARPPANENQRPHPAYLDWHRRNCFKA